MTQIEVLEYIIGKGPGRTQVQLAEAIHGPEGYQQQVNQDCSMLVNTQRVICQGTGGLNDPHRYYPR
jgi:hypothetical protein